MTSIHPREHEIFSNLCEDISPDEVAALRTHVADHTARLQQSQTRSELIAIDLAFLVRDRLERLFEVLPKLQATDRALVVGAARYFSSRDDAIPDTKACTGLDDDVRVVNHVLTALGRGEWRIEE
jgi:uncharacterized membrane protein YkvA (DUF1232 family)